MIGNKKHFLVAGATGLVGTSLVEQLLAHPAVGKVTILVRKPTGTNHPKLAEKVIDYDLFSEKDFPKQVDATFCCLGTTMRKAGSKAAFKLVDYDYVVKLAIYTQRCKIPQFHVISAAGANPKATIYYNRVKGNMEIELEKLNKIKGLFLYYPSMLLGKRNEFRFGESIGKALMKAFSVMIPKTYKAIYDWQVAKAMIDQALKNGKGIHRISNAEMIENSEKTNG